MESIVINGWKLFLLIDRITFRYPIAETDFMTYACQMFALHGEGETTLPRIRSFHDIDCYRAKMVLRRNRGIVITLYKGYGHCGIKFDWSPRLINAETIDRFSRLLGAFIPDGFDGLAARGIISYLEIAVDVVGARVEDYLVWHPRFARSCLYFNARDNSQTAYLGTRRSRKSFCMYDKRKQLRARHGRVMRGERLRIEYRTHEPIRLQDLANLPVPFALLEIATLNDARVRDHSAYFQRFLDQCEDEGEQRAISRYSQHAQRRFRQLLRQTRPEWACFAEIWQSWPEVVRDFERTHGAYQTGRPFELTNDFEPIGP